MFLRNRTIRQHRPARRAGGRPPRMEATFGTPPRRTEKKRRHVANTLVSIRQRVWAPLWFSSVPPMAICRGLGNGRDKSTWDRPAGSGDATIGENVIHADVQKLKPTSLGLPTLRINTDDPTDEVSRQGRQNIAVGKSPFGELRAAHQTCAHSVSGAVQRGN